MTHYPLLLHGDALDILPTLIAGTVDVVVEDRPAGIGFMGKTWDSFATYEPRSERGHEVLNGLDLLGGMPRWASGFVTFEVARARILGASGSIEEAQRGNDGAEVGSQLGLL